MAANTSNTSQAVENLIAANPPQTQGLTAVEQAQNIVNPGSVTPAGMGNYASPVQEQATRTGQMASIPSANPYYPTPGSDNWGQALTSNNAARAAAAGNDYNGEPTVIYHMEQFGTMDVASPKPNPVFAQIVAQMQEEILRAHEAAQEEASSEVLTGGETPITQSAASEEVDKLIDASNEVVDEINTNTPPEAPPVDIKQETITIPTPITPTELVLTAQASCEGTPRQMDINIEIINNIATQVTASATATAFATASAFAEAIASAIIPGCMDPDASNYDPNATIMDGSCEYLPKDPVKGCTNPEALNYDPDATEDDGSCQFEAVLPPIPPMSQFLDSHGQIIFEVPKELVEDEGVVDMPKGNNVKLTATRDLVNPKAKNPIVRPAPVDKDVESDLILTSEEMSVATRKQIRKQLVFGKLASDEEEDGTKDVIIRKAPADTKVVRNDKGAILISTNTPIIKASLQSQAFVYEDYRKAIDTSFSELVGKM